MDAATLALIITTLGTVIAAVAAAYTTVRKGEVIALEKRVEVLEKDLADERTAHKATRTEMTEALNAEIGAHRDTRKELTTTQRALTDTRRELDRAYEKIQRLMGRDPRPDTAPS